VPLSVEFVISTWPLTTSTVLVTGVPTFPDESVAE
jgi:hypothetical protein